LVAWHPKASEENERTTIVIENNTFGSILYRQVAGALARRIVNYAEEGMQVVQGTDAGFIKFGSELICFYLSVQSTLCLIKSSGRENHYCYKSIMIGKELDIGFRLLLLLSDASLGCPATFIY
jgi:phosphatidylserine decarboxylase